MSEYGIAEELNRYLSEKLREAGLPTPEQDDAGNYEEDAETDK